MKTRALAVAALLAFSAVAIFAGSAAAQDGAPPPPSAGEKLADINGATGSTIGPDGALYVVENGDGGDTTVQLPEEQGGGEGHFGLSAQITRIDPETGEKTVAAGGLPSFESGGEAFSASDLVFHDGKAYFVLAAGANYLGIEEWPNGIYRVEDNGAINLVANIGDFNDDHPVDFPDAVPGGNPFAIDVRGNDFYVTDGNYNRLLRVGLNGGISIVAAWDNIVPTGIETGSGGPVLVTWFSPFPHNPDESKVLQVGIPSGDTTELASGYSQMIDVEFGPGGVLYVLQFGDQQLDENAPPPPGRILRLEDGMLTPVVEGLFLPTSLDFNGDTAFVTTLGGEVWKIENFSSLQLPPPASPTVAPPTTTPINGVIAPDTGSGGYDASEAGGAYGLVAIALAVAAALTAGGAVALRRRAR